MVKRLLRAANRILILPLALAMILTCLPGMSDNVFAADPIAKLNGETYWNFGSLADDLYDLDDQRAEIEMLCDWDRTTDRNVKERLIIPADCTAILNMNGHMYNRRLSQGPNWESNGELFILHERANLTINGGHKDFSHDVYVHVSTSRDHYAEKRVTRKGGVLAGGSSTNGAGCIHMREHSSLTLNAVTIAGCRAEQSLGSDGYGGAIYCEPGRSGDAVCSVSMNGSSIEGCYAYNDGGAVYTGGPRNKIVMKGSSVINNFAAGDGGGIAYNYAISDLKGDSKTVFSGNRAAGNGGALWINQRDLSVSGLEITGNYADRGGGIYVNKNNATIASCNIHDNGAGFSGGGVYVASNISKMTVSGNTVIKDNGQDLYISDDDPDDTRVSFDLVKGAEVHVRYYDTKNKDKIMVTPGSVGDSFKNKDCTKYLKAENEGYRFDYGRSPNQRKIYYIKGSKPPVPEPTPVAAADANNASAKEGGSGVKAGKVAQIQYKGCDVIRGFYLHEKADSGAEDTTAVFYYSDGFFMGEPATYDEHLATASYSLALAGTYLRKFDDPDTNDNIYYNKHAGARQFLADIGCPDQNIYVNDSMVSKPGADSIGCTIGSKELAMADGTQTGRILIPVTVRGGGYEAEWASNTTLGPGTARDGEAQGFSEAADQVTREIDNYINKYSLKDEIAAGKVVFWVVGHSRAGATANITSKRLVEKYADGSEGKQNKVFGYTCEAAQGGTDKAQKLADDKYFCIHNLVNATDVVPLVAPSYMGFKRYGVDHYVPGASKRQTPEKKTASADGAGSSGITQVTTYADNEPLLTKTTAYNQFRDGFNSVHGKSIYEQLKSIDSDIIFDDYFHPMAMDFAPSPEMYENGSYDNNRLEDFLTDFFRAAQEGILPAEKDTTGWSKAVASRKVWAEDKTRINDVDYATLQSAMRDSMALLFSIDAKSSESFVERASEMANAIDIVGGEVSMWELYRKVIGAWHDRTDAEKEHYIRFLWNSLKDTGALDYLEPEEAAKLETNWPALANFLFVFMDNDYNYEPGDHASVSKWAHGMTKSMTYVPTFATFSSSILNNHAPEVNIAWNRMYDDWYDPSRGDFTEYAIEPPASIAAAKAYVKQEAPQEEQELTPNKPDANRLTGDQKIILENKEIAGEAVYYDLVDMTGSHETLATNQIYRGGVDLTMDGAKTKTYKLTTYDMSYNVKSERSNASTYYINLIDDRHDVTVNDLVTPEDTTQESAARTQTFSYHEGDVVHLTAGQPAGKVFTSWTAKDDQDRAVTDTIFSGQYEAYKTNANAAFVMPMPDTENGFSAHYTLTFTAHYNGEIEEITAGLAASAEGTDLSAQATVSFDTIEGTTFSYPVTWTYRDGDKTVVDTGTARAGTVYTAYIDIPKNEAQGIAFADNVRATAEGADASVSGNPSATKNAADGSVRVAVTFPATAGNAPSSTASVKVSVNAYDMNTGQVIGTTDYYVEPGDTLTLSPDAVTDERFYQWNMLESGITINGEEASRKTTTDRTVTLTLPSSETDLTIQAEYMPVVKSVSIVMDAPVGGQEMPSQITSLNFTVSQDCSIDPECTQLMWTPTPPKDSSDKDIAAYDVPYTATVKLKPYPLGHEHAGKVKATIGGEVKYISAVFVPSDTATATVNGRTAGIDMIAQAIRYTFPATKYDLSAEPADPADITGIEHGTDEDGIRALLPGIKLLRSDGLEVDAKSVDWALSKEEPTGPLGTAVWTATGTVELPDNMENRAGYDLTVSMQLVVNEADRVASPIASADSGTYLSDQSVTLTTDTEGAVIWYTTDGSDPCDEGGTRRQYENPITISWGAGVTLKAYATKNGWQDSYVTTYTYEFTDEVPIPRSYPGMTYIGQLQVGIPGSPYYTLTAEEGTGLIIDEEGNAAAVLPGTYTVTASIREGYKWKLGDGTTTTADQTLQFTIGRTPICDVARVTAEGSFTSLDELKKALKIEPLDGVTLTEGTDYEVSYGDIRDGKVTVVVTGKGNYSDYITSTFIIGEVTKYTITLDLNGGKLDGRTGIITEEYPADTVITLPKPSRKGYAFRYWKGSKYEAGDRYKVSENHTFKAQWKAAGKSGDKSKSGGSYSKGTGRGTDSSRTGDDIHNRLSVIALILAAIASGALLLLRRRES